MELAKAIERSTYEQGNKERISWFNVSKLMNEDRSPEYYRAQYRRQMGTHDPKQKVRVSANKAKAQGHTEPKSILAQELKKTRTIDELIKATGMSELEGKFKQLANELKVQASELMNIGSHDTYLIGGTLNFIANAIEIIFMGEDETE